MAEAQSEGLAEELCDALADTFAFYFKAHAFHWNVTGPTFSQLHQLFGDIYADAHDAVDSIAEHIRTLDDPAPMNLRELLDESDIKEAKAVSASAMVKELLADNATVIKGLGQAYFAAEKEHEIGISNFLQDRIDRHAKWHWMLRATAREN